MALCWGEWPSSSEEPQDEVPKERLDLRSQQILVEVERLLLRMESRLREQIEVAHRDLQDKALGSVATSHSAPVSHPEELPERSAHFYRARVPEHFRQLVNDSIHEGTKKGLGTTRSVGESFQWDTFRFAAPMLNSCAALCEIATLILVIAYTVLMGISLELLSQTGTSPVWARPVDLIFSGLFAIDVIFRICLEGRHFFLGLGARWNVVDMFIVFVILISQVLSEFGQPHLGSISVLRLLRIMRILGVARLLKFFCRWRAFRYMRTLAVSIVETSKSILPLMAFMLAIVYLFGMVLTEGVWEHCIESPDLICETFGTLSTSMMTLFQIVYHGILWGPVWEAFWTHETTWFLRFIFLLFIFFALIVVANVVSSFLFAIQKKVGDQERDTLIQNEIESKEEFLRSMALVFKDFDQNSNGAISWTEFQLALEDERMLAFLASMGLDISDAVGLFEVLDSDSTGAIEQMEFLLGCLRLRGGAKSVDLVRVQMEQEWVHRAMQQMRSLLEDVARAMKKLQKPVQDSPSLTPEDVIIESRIINESYPLMHSTPLMTPKKKHRTQLLPQERSVTLQELELISGSTEACRAQGWKDETGKVLQPHEVNLYHFNYDYILPQTAPDEGIQLKGLKGTADVGDEIFQGSSKRPGALGIILRATHDDRGLNLVVKMQKGRFTASVVDGTVKTSGADHGLPHGVIAEGSISYKELLSPMQRMAAWYCSHWWGEPIRSFVTCCKRHAHFRGMSIAEATYWVCGYANRQHELAEEIGRGLQDSSFYQALQVSHGILLILDSEAKPFTRIWCDYELYAAITDASKELDIVTATGPAAGPSAMMLSKNLLPQESAVAKSVREQTFPLHFLLRGLHVRLEDGDATVEEDKLKILSAIAGEDVASVRGQELLATNLLRANNTLHSTLAVLAWPQAMQRGLLGEMRLADVLAKDVTRERLELSLAHFETSCTDAALQILATGLPPNLRELHLSFEGCRRITDSGVSALMRHLSAHLKLLYLDFIGCTLLSDQSIQALAHHMPPMLEELQLHVAGCEAIGTQGVQELKSSCPSSLQQFRGTFKGTALNRNFRNVQELLNL